MIDGCSGDMLSAHRAKTPTHGDITLKTILTTTTLTIVLTAVLHAQATLTGKWEGKTKNGFQIVLDLTATETALAGTLTREGQPAKITDGKVSKKSFTFKALLGDQVEGFTGGLDGDQITVWMDRQGPVGTVILKRATK
jgi:hypothetical protein